MISLYNTLKESLLGNFEDIEASADPKKEIEEFINNYYFYYGKIKISNKPNKNGKYIVDGRSVTVKAAKNNISSLTNGMFEWGVVKNNFDCSSCGKLISLEGAPKKVSGDFYCFQCTSLTSLEGAPEEVGRDFNCSICNSLTSLEGAPKEVDGSFRCACCNSLTSLEGAPEEVSGFSCANCTSLISLEGAPKKVLGSFNCSNCKFLTSLEGAPKEVSRDFYCRGCNHQWKIEYIKARSEIKGNIFI